MSRLTALSIFNKILVIFELFLSKFGNYLHHFYSFLVIFYHCYRNMVIFDPKFGHICISVTQNEIFLSFSQILVNFCFRTSWQTGFERWRTTVLLKLRITGSFSIRNSSIQDHRIFFLLLIFLFYF